MMNNIDLAKTRKNFTLMYAYTGAAAVTAVFIISIILLRIVFNTCSDSMKNNMNQLETVFNNFEATANTLSLQLFYDRDIEELRRNIPDEEELQRVKERLDFYKSADAYIESVMVADLNNKVFYSSGMYAPMKLSDTYILEDGQKKAFLRLYDEENSRELYSYIIKPYVYIPFEIVINYYQKKLDFDFSEHFDYVVYNEKNEVMLNSSGNGLDGGNINYIIQSNKTNGSYTGKINGRKYLITFRNTGNYIFVCYSQFMILINRMINIICVIIAALLLFITGIILVTKLGIKKQNDFFGMLFEEDRKLNLIYRIKEDNDKLKFLEGSAAEANDEFLRKASEYGFDKEKKYNMLVLRLDKYRDFLSGNTQREQQALKFSITNVVSELLAENKFIWEINFNDEFVFIFESLDSRYVVGQIRKAQNIMNEQLGISFSAFILPDSFNICQIHDRYTRTKKLSQYKLYYGSGCILDNDTIMKKSGEFNRYDKCWSMLLDSLKEKKFERLGELYKRALTELEKSDPETFILENKLLIFELNKICSGMNINISSELYSLFDDISRIEEKNDLENAFMNVFGKINEYKVEELADSEIGICNNARIYIEENYGDISLCRDNIADEIGISVRKLDSVFKKVMGVTITNYIKEMRIEKAKIMLTDTKLPISEISKKVGFKTDSHFGYMFKKSTGITPVMYRNKKQ